MDFSQLIGPVGGALIALGGVALTNFMTGLRERRARTEMHLSRLVSRRYDLYMRYINVLDKNADILSGDDLMSLDEGEIYSEILSLEREMAVFASGDVLATFELCRDAIRAIALQWEAADAAAKGRLRNNLNRATTAALAMVRADLQVDSHDSWLRNRTRRRRVARLLQNAQQQSMA